MTPAERRALVQSHVRHADIAARTITRRFRWLEPYADDLRQEAAVGLCEAAKKFDPDRGVKFSTFAFSKMQWAIRNYIDTRLGSIWSGSGRKGAGVAVSELLLETLPSLAPSPETAAYHRELADRTRGFLHKVARRRNATARRNNRPSTGARDVGVFAARLLRDPNHVGEASVLAAGLGISRERVRQIQNEVEAEFTEWAAGVRAEVEAA